MLKIRKLENNVLRLAWRKGKICLRYFKGMIYQMTQRFPINIYKYNET